MTVYMAERVEASYMSTILGIFSTQKKAEEAVEMDRRYRGFDREFHLVYAVEVDGRIMSCLSSV